MSLIKCTECGNEISEKAEVCPVCGYRTEEGNASIKKKQLTFAFILSQVIFLIGLYMVVTGSEQLSDASWINWYEDAEEISWQVTLGHGMILGSFIGDIVIHLKGKALKEEEKTRKRIADAQKAQDNWKCDCGCLNSRSVIHCKQCGHDKPFAKNQTPDHTPFWRRSE